MGEAVQAAPVPRRPDATDLRLNRVWHLLFAATLAVPTGISMLDARSDPGRLLAIAALVAGFAGWHWALGVRHPERWRRARPMVVFWAGGIAFTFALVSLHASFMIALYGLYPLMFATMGWWGMLPIVGVTALVGVPIGAWDDGTGAVTSVLITAGVSAVLGAFVETVTQQSERRREALEALAATRAELAATARHAGMLEERERLAREIHDTVAQGLTSIVTQLEAADDAFADRPADARRHLEAARLAARNALGEVRRSVRALRPDLLESVPLSQALERTCRRWSADTGILAELRSTGTPTPLHPDTETALLRTVQEALANIAKHAAASRATVTLSYLGETVTLDVDDDGVGFSGVLAPRTDGGYGLTGMRERIEAVGGRLAVESTPGQGTTVAASVPS